MKISELVKQLQAIEASQGDVDVMFYADNEGTFSAERVDFRVAEEDQYPDDWNMPAGTEFVEISN